MISSVGLWYSLCWISRQPQSLVPPSGIPLDWLLATDYTVSWKQLKSESRRKKKLHKKADAQRDVCSAFVARTWCCMALGRRVSEFPPRWTSFTLHHQRESLVKLKRRRHHYQAIHVYYMSYEEERTQFRARPVSPNEGTHTFSKARVMAKVFTDLRAGETMNAESDLLSFSSITASPVQPLSVDCAGELKVGGANAFIPLVGV